MIIFFARKVCVTAGRYNFVQFCFVSRSAIQILCLQELSWFTLFAHASFIICFSSITTNSLSSLFVHAYDTQHLAFKTLPDTLGNSIVQVL